MENYFLSKITAIISDFDFGNGVNFINSNLIGGIENEEEEFTGKIILCTGFNENTKSIPDQMKIKLIYFFKKAIVFSEIIEMMKTKNRRIN